jgi:hypothetical protein
MRIFALWVLPGNLFVFGAALIFVAGGLVWYALRIKGDVRAVFSHGKTVLELEAKERGSGRK